jgi:hypothetical protein
MDVFYLCLCRYGIYEDDVPWDTEQTLALNKFHKIKSSIIQRYDRARAAAGSVSSRRDPYPPEISASTAAGIQSTRVNNNTSSIEDAYIDPWNCLMLQLMWDYTRDLLTDSRNNIRNCLHIQRIALHI